MIRVLIVDDNPVIRRGVAALLSDAADIKVVGEAGDGHDAISLAASASPMSCYSTYGCR